MKHTKGTITQAYKKVLEKRYDIQFTMFEKSEHPRFSCHFCFNYPASSDDQIEIYGHVFKDQYVSPAVDYFFHKFKGNLKKGENQ